MSAFQVHFVPKIDQTRILQDALRASQSFTPIGNLFPLQGPPFIEGSRLFRLEMAEDGRDPRIYMNETKRMQFLAQLQQLNCGTNRRQRRSDWRSAEVEPEGILPTFAEEVSEVQTISPTVRRTVPAELTPSNLLAAAEGAWSSPGGKYRGSVMPTWHPSAMAPTPVRLPMFQHPTGKGWGHEPVGTNRKRLGNRAGPLGQTRSMPVPPSPVAYNDGLCPPSLRVRQKTLAGSVEVESYRGSWLEKMEAACDV